MANNDFDEFISRRKQQIAEEDDSAQKIDPMDAFIARRKGESDLKTRESLSKALPRNPDAWADTAILAADNNIPIQAADSYKDELDIRDRRRKAEATLSGSPALKRQMEDESFATVAHDDLDTLAKIERAQRTHMADALTHKEFETIKTAGEFYDKALKGSGQQIAEGVYEGMPAAIEHSFLQTMRDGYGNLSGDVMTSASMALAMGSIDQKQYNTLLESAGHLDKDLRERMEKTEKVIASLSPADMNWFESGVRGGWTSLATTAPMAGATMITGNPYYMMGAAGFVTWADSYRSGTVAGMPYSQAMLYSLTDAGLEMLTE